MDFSRCYEEESSPSSLSPRRKTRPTIMLSCCIRNGKSEERPAIRSPSSWIRFKSRELPEIKQRCRGLMARIGNSTRRPYGEFRYDPISYALNFDDGGDNGEAGEEEYRFGNFSARLPASVDSGGIACN